MTGTNESHKAVSHPTIFHEILNSGLPETEKTASRLADEAQLIITAGLFTVASALVFGSFHLVKDQDAVAKLRRELASVQQPLDWRALERLPYLSGCVRESIRLSIGVSTRDPRVSPNKELRYGKWTIPRNTPVSMTSLDVLMNENIFPEPKSFLPERWVREPELEQYFVPFGRGTRQCLGIK